MSRQRLSWDALPGYIRGEIEGRLGSAVVGAESHEGGYSPGMAATLTTQAGERAFVKAVSTSFHERSAELYRDEARINALLPAGVPAPAMRWSFERGDWIAMGFEAADSAVTVPWQAADLAAALELFTMLAAIPAPPGLGSIEHHLAAMPTWAHIVADRADLSSWDPWVAAHLALLTELSADWAASAVGETLGHGDARADNMVRSRGRLLLADWPYACAAAPWLELLCFLPSAELEGAGDAAQIWSAHPLGQAADQGRATAVLSGLAGFFVHGSLQPPPPGIPHLRAYQRAQGEVALGWLRQRLE